MTKKSLIMKDPEVLPKYVQDDVYHFLDHVDPEESYKLIELFHYLQNDASTETTQWMNTGVERDYSVSCFVILYVLRKVAETGDVGKRPYGG